ncbi:hypothetical protein LNV23_19100 [Paucibacter sp. DJ1R-11]|uniref:hypothetical protein n=1 Tax=Paucibacter sp. DJ1R-11 TaxID=2893556 RepID=UPI0021E503FB|nr:hypothetical protein [Paucibacter sp. DJ1R-11]MCV2365562.1 hypothetical protein [Paucibacter sp. DJ1R-11]
MKDRPILFNGAMVRAILAGTKTQTRRVMKAVRHPDFGNLYEPSCLAREEQHAIERACPYGQPGDRLWVRETFAHIYRDNAKPDERRDDDVAYKADHPGLDEYAFGTWKPSIHMPRWASRITLEITSVRVERLQDISEADAKAEGIYKTEHGFWSTYGQLIVDGTYSPSVSFHALWQSVNGAEGPTSWTGNPWVWVVEFKRVEAST